ncbi:hypothetical protein AB4571_15365 [Vibrio breoganii]|uniref:hypothetical protein n=1 Tax=Vibrio breoganii TaxID=553239 RepID=UPI0010561F3A|nr:hypothetical protein [Vibrio breoganii]
MERLSLLALLAIVSSGVWASQDYLNVLSGVSANAGYVGVTHSEALNQDGGVNPTTHSENANRTPIVEVALSVASSERDSIIAEIRSGSVSRVNLADSSGTAVRAHDTERNWIISTARSRFQYNR